MSLAVALAVIAARRRETAPPRLDPELVADPRLSALRRLGTPSWPGYDKARPTCWRASWRAKGGFARPSPQGGAERLAPGSPEQSGQELTPDGGARVSRDASAPGA